MTQPQSDENSKSRKPPNDALLFWGLMLLFTALCLLTVLTGCRGRNDPHDACGGSGSHPVTIGGVMVVGCR